MSILATGFLIGMRHALTLLAHGGTVVLLDIELSAEAAAVTSVRSL